MQWTNCPESLLPEAVKYFGLYFVGAPIQMLYNSFASVLRAGGDTKRPMMFSMTGGVVKVLMNYFCVAILGTTVEGVAFATISSHLVSASLCYFALIHSREHFDFKLRNMKFNRAEMKQILFIGVPSGLQTSLYSFANVVIATAVNSMGTAATTGIAIANQFDGILYQIIHAPGVAAISYVSQNVGARKFDRVKKSILSACFVAVAFGATIGSFSAMFSRQLASIISSTPEVIVFARQKMIIVSSTYFICGINEVLGATLKAMGKPIIPTIATLLFMCLLRFPWVYFVFPLLKNLTLLYLVWPVGWILSIITLLIAYFPAMKKMKNTNPSA